ncbi:MAG: triose-phosphate isomerase [Bryobacter sp.]
MRKPLLAANWKMFKTPAETTTFFDAFLPLVKDAAHAEIAVCAPFVDLPAAVAATAGTNVAVGGQNLYWAKEGAFTGEISGPMLKAVGCQWVIVGHSERRQYFGETDASVLERTRAALAAGLGVILCVGEMLTERENGETNAVLATQFAGGVAGLTPEEFAGIVIAYEPVWAIGTGKTATPAMAAEAHATIRSLAADAFGAEAAERLRILYGGSVKPDNVKALMSEGEIDGALVGGASLDPASFAKIVNFAG